MVFIAFRSASASSDLAMRNAAMRFRVGGTGSVGSAASSAAAANLPSSGSATLTQVESAALAIFDAAINLGFSVAQATAIAKAAAIAYAAAIAQGLSPAQASQAAAAAASAAALQAEGVSDPISMALDLAVYAAAFVGVLAQVPTSSQGAAEAALIAYLQGIGL